MTGTILNPNNPIDYAVNLAKNCFRNILLNKIFYMQTDDQDNFVNTIPVPIYTEFPPREGLNCITMSKGGGLGKIESYERYNILETVSPGSPGSPPYYDPSDPNEEYAKQRIRWDVYDESIVIHVWATTNELRDHIVRNVKDIITSSKECFYPFCDKYNTITGVCSTTSNQCDAPSGLTFDSIENRCPYPDITDPNDPNYRNPSTYYTDAGIRVESVDVKGETTADQLGIVPPIHHSTIPFTYIRDAQLIINSSPLLNLDLELEDQI